jgi:hypothetical protein
MSGMKLKRLAIASAAMFVALLLGGNLLPGAAPGAASFVATAYAWIGRPATPVSVAGVARRTTRRTVAATSAYYH